MSESRLYIHDKDALLDRLGMLGGALFHDKKGRPVELPPALAPLADTHGHLTHFRSLDPAVALVRAALAGVRMLVVPLDPTDDGHEASARLSWLDEQVGRAGELLDAARRIGIEPPVLAGDEDLPDLLENVRIVAGVHPYGARDFLGRGEKGAEFGASSHEALRELLTSPRCAGVGEIGIDLGPWNELPEDVQLEAFSEQLAIARELGLPVELHIRDGEGDTEARAHRLAAELLAREGVPSAGCDLHCYTSGPEVLEPFTALGCHAAFGGAVTFGRSADIRAAAAACPEQLLLSETDSPYMAPVPLRGRECEPAMVAFSAACVAQVREEAGVAPAAQTYGALWHNAVRLLG